MIELVSNITGIIGFFYPHVASLLCKAMPDDNSLSLKVRSFLTSETQKIMDRQKGVAGGEYFNACARLYNGLILLNGMVPKDGVKVSEMHSLFVKDVTKTEQRRKIVQDHFSCALDSANKCFGMGQEIKQSSLKPEQTIDALQIIIFCNTLLNLESYAPQINFSVMVDNWIRSVKYLYSDPNVKIIINENVKRKMFRNKEKSIALFGQIEALLVTLLKTAESMQPVGGENDMTRLNNEVHQSELLQHHYFLAGSFLKTSMQQVLPVALLLREQEKPDGVIEVEVSHSDLETMKDIKAYLQLTCENVRTLWGKLLNEPSLDKCYVEPAIIIEEDRKRKNKATGKSVYNYKELFDINTLGDRIIIEGDPGMGKTTYVNKLSLDWTREEGSEHYSDDSKFLQSKFSNVFLIPLRNLNGGRVTTFLQATSIQLDNCWSWLRSNYQAKPTDSLLILDAFDEYDGSCPEINKIIHGSLFPRLKVIITTRPSHLERLTIKHQWLSITGLTTPEKQERFLIKQGWDKLTERDIIINVLTNFSTLWKTPLYLGILCVLYKAKELTGFDPRNPNCFYVLVKLFTEHIMSRKAREGKEKGPQLSKDERLQVKSYVQKFAIQQFTCSNHWIANFFETPTSSSDTDGLRKLAGQFGLLSVQEELSPVTGDSVESMSFVHQLFLEYYAAVEFGTIFNSCTDKKGLVKLIDENLNLTDSPFSYFLAAECQEYKEILVKGQTEYCQINVGACATYSYIESFPWLPQILISNDVYHKYGQTGLIDLNFNCNHENIKSFWDIVYVKELCSIAKPRIVTIHSAALGYHDQSLDYILSLVNELLLYNCKCDHVNLDKQYPNLTNLAYWSNWSNFPKLMNDLVAMLNHFPNLHRLSLGDVKITTESIDLFCDSLENMNQLQELALSECFNSPQSVQHVIRLAKTIESSLYESLKYLYLCSNILDTETETSSDNLMRAISKCVQLEDLTLSHCFTTSQSVQHVIRLAKTIETSSICQSLKKLDLRGNILDTETESSSDILMGAISKCVQLEKLDLWWCQIKVQSLDITKEIIQNSPHLKNNLKYLYVGHLDFIPPHTVTKEDIGKWESDIQSILPHCHVNNYSSLY